jgi:hypothetical protein
MCAAQAAFISVMAATLQPPAVYWVSSPTLANETILIAGAGLSNASITSCEDAACTSSTTEVSVVGAVHSWEQSVQMVLPLNLCPPLYLKIKTAAGEVSVAVNKPDGACCQKLTRLLSLPPPRACACLSLSLAP